MSLITSASSIACLNCDRHSNFVKLTSKHSPGDKVSRNEFSGKNSRQNMDDIREFGEQIKKNGNVERLHIIGGEPLIHPEIDEIVDYFRDEIWLDYVPEINIVSNMHKNLNDKYDQL